MYRKGYNIYCCSTSFFDHYIGGAEEAEYASSVKDSQQISDLRLIYLIKNSIKVIVESRSRIKYFYLIFHLWKLLKHTTKKQRKLLLNTLKQTFGNYIKRKVD